MAGTIVVGIPDRCYISPDPVREFPFEFYFHITYGAVPKESRMIFSGLRGETDKATVYPQITVCGFEQLLSADKIDGFISGLKKTGNDDWIIKKNPRNSNILFQYTGDSLPADFSFRAATEKFISTAAENNLVTLTVSVRNFESMEDTDYIIYTKVDYTPWAKSLKAAQTAVPFDTQLDIDYECMGDDIDKRLYQNGLKLDSARSPYTAHINKPSLFRLEVFNQRGMSDEAQLSIDILPPVIQSFLADKYTFSAGEAIRLTWQTESVSDLAIEGLNPQTDTIAGNSAKVFPVPSMGERTKQYTLRVSGYKEKRPYSTWAQVLLYQSKWGNSGAVSGFVAGEAFANINYNSHIFTVGGQYYCYAHPALYQSADGLKWKIFLRNDCADASFICLAADFYDGVLHAMGKQGENGSTLFISEFDFKASVWSYSAAGQSCCSAIAGFACSQKKMQYAQVRPNGILIVKRGDDGAWNAGTSILLASGGTTVISGDYCFFKNRNYGVLLCDNNCVYVYDCEKSMEDVLFIKDIGKRVQFASFVQTVSNLYLMAGDVLIRVNTQAFEDPFPPPFDAMTSRPWLGANKDNHVFGVFPDENLWVLND